MDASRFDRLSKALAGANTRRGLVQAAAALAIAGVPALQDDAAGARRRGKGQGNQGVGAETFNHKKRWYCLNEESIRRYRRKQEKLLAQGATLGKCPSCIPATCASLGAVCPVDDGCGGTLQCGNCLAIEFTCCAGQCAILDQDDNNCGTCGNVCVAPLRCIGGACQLP